MQFSGITTVSLTLLLALTGSAAYGGEFNLVANIGDPMPEFNNLPSVGGDTVSSTDLTEDVVVLAFLAKPLPMG